MKKVLSTFILLSGVLFACQAQPAFAKSKISGRVFSLVDQAVAATPTADLGEVNRFSVQVNVSSSNPAIVTVAAASVDSASDLIIAANTYGTGQGVSLSTTTNVALTGLTFGTTYFVVPISIGRTFKLATTANNAIAGTTIDISTTTATNYLFLPSTFTAGSCAYILQASNDGVNWITATSTASVAIAGSGISSLIYDAQFFNERFLRLSYTAPTRGGSDIDVWIQGKNDE